MKVCIAIFVLGLALASADTVPAEVLSWDEHRAICIRGALVSCECSKANACQAVAVKPQVDGSGICTVTPKPERTVTAKGLCQEGVEQRVIVANTVRADCPGSFSVSQCLAYRSIKSLSFDFKIEETERVGNSCVVKSPASDEDQNRQLYVQAICIREYSV